MNTAVNSKRLFFVTPHRLQGFAEILGQTRPAARFLGAKDPGLSGAGAIRRLE